MINPCLIFFFGTDPDVDDDSSRQDADTLHQVSQHVDESRPDAGVGVAVMVAPVPPVPPLGPARGQAVSVAVWGPRLVEDQGHPAEKSPDWSLTAGSREQKQAVSSLVVLTGR